jgi:general secretion pathway protein D
MKTNRTLLLLTCFAALLCQAVAQSEPPTPAKPADTPPPATQPATPPADAPPADPSQPPPAEGSTTAAPAAKPEPETVAPTPAPEPVRLVADGEAGLRLNFRNAPLELVLDYLSEAAGFTIIPEGDVKGKIDVWSNQPLTKEEALDVLSKALSRNDYTMIRDGRTLTILSKSDARKRDIPVKSGYEPEGIPKNDEVVTQIIPVRFINAVQLSKDLLPLIPASATMTANEGGNALVITDTQTNIRRMAEIIKALDTTVSSLSSVKVFALKFADAKTLATVIKEVFTSADASRNTGRGGGRGGMFNFMGGGPGGGGDAGGAASSSGRPGAGKVVATADERSNSLIVSAPEDIMPTIEDMVATMDTNVEDVTEIRVFRLQFADPQEMSDLLTSLFPDPAQNTQNRGFGRFGGFGGFGGVGGGGNNAAAGQSERQMRQSKVIAVPDMRTSSVVVTAARDTMDQISRMIEQLDANPAKKQKVFVFDLKNADVYNAEEVVRNLFQGANSRNTSTQNRSALETREQQMQNQQNTGFGAGSSGGGGMRGSGGF